MKAKEETKNIITNSLNITKIKRKSQEELIIDILTQNGLSDKFKRNPRSRQEIPYSIKERYDNIDWKNIDNYELIKEIYGNDVLEQIKISSEEIMIKFEPIVIVGTDVNEITYNFINYHINNNTGELMIVENSNKLNGNAMDLTVVLNSIKEVRQYDKYGIEMKREIYKLEKDINNISYNDIIWYNGKTNSISKDIVWFEYSNNEYDFITKLCRENVACINVNTTSKYYNYSSNKILSVMDNKNLSELNLKYDTINYENWNNPMEICEDIKKRTEELLKANANNSLDPFFKGIVKLAKRNGYNTDILLGRK